MHLVIYHVTDSRQLSSFIDRSFQSIKFIESEPAIIHGPCAIISEQCLKTHRLPTELEDSQHLTCYVDYALNDQHCHSPFVHFTELNPQAEYGEVAINGLGPLDLSHFDGLTPTGLFIIPEGISIHLEQLNCLPIERLKLHPQMPHRETARPALFLDRDGVINEDTEYLIDPKDLRIKDGIVEVIQLANQLKWPVICLTNQSGVARGKFSLTQVESLHQEMKNQLAHQGARIDHFEISPFHYAKGVGEFKKRSVLRKPYPGMLLKACRFFDVELERSVMIGDKESDLLHFSPATTFLLQGAYALGAKGRQINNFQEVLNFIRN